VDRATDAARLLADLGDWAATPGPRFRALARAIGAEIERGAVGRGARLPAERVVAATLGVSRGTVVAAYDDLVAGGLVERRVGSGTFALGDAAVDLPPGREGSALFARLVDRSSGPGEVPDDLLDLSISVLADLDAMAGIRLDVDDLRHVDPDTGYSPWGLGGLRRAIAEEVTAWDLPTTDAQVVVTTGAQQAISVAAACWIRPGDVVLVEDLTYPGALVTFAAAGAEVVGVRVDGAGVVVDDLARCLRRRPSLVYLQSTVHSPTGVVLPAARRRAIARLLADARVPLVEDLALAALAWDPPPPPIAAFAPDLTSVVVGSLSKRFWGGLRVGFARAPEPVARRLARVKATQDLGSSAVAQVLAERLLAAPDLEQRASDRRTMLRRRADLLAEALAERLPTWRVAAPAGGLSLWARLPTPNADAFARHALGHGVAVATAATLSPSTGADGAHRDGLRLSFALDDAALRSGVERLAAAWATFDR
jgi:DNA-binding transcriptional MocR family regulator